MYPFEPVRPAWEALIAAIHDRLPWVPAGLDWTEDVHDAWRDPSCVLSHACGWPVAALLRDEVRVAGAFSLSIPGSDGYRYRSVLLATRSGSPAEFARHGVVAGANSRDSLSGWVSLVAATVGPGGRWPGEVRWTGAHTESLRAVREGRVDIACIDALTLAHLQRIDPGATDGLFEVGRGPWIPSPAIVIRRDATDERLADTRAAFADVFADPALAGARAALLLDGFVPLGNGDYESLLALTPAV